MLPRGYNLFQPGPCLYFSYVNLLMLTCFAVATVPAGRSFGKKFVVEVTN